MTALLITGGAKRIGRAIVDAAVVRGFAVAIHYNRSSRVAEDLAQSINAAGGQAVTVAADLADEAATSTLVARASGALGVPLTALVNNASLFEVDDWASDDADLWARHHAVNLRAPFLLSQAFARQAKTQTFDAGQSNDQTAGEISSGSTPGIVNIVDQRVWNLNPQFFSYTLSKAGLWTMTQTLAQALAPNVRVNAVGPGPVLQSIHQDGGTFDHEARNTPLEQSVDPGDIAEAVLYLLNAQRVTGQMIAVDSGQHLAWKTPDVVGP